MENQIISFIPELTKQVENGNKTQTRRLKGLEKVNVSPDDYRFDGVDEKDANIYYFEELKVGEPTENYIIARSKYKVGEIINVESTDKKIQITAVRAERLQNISEEDVIAEGVKMIKKGDEYRCIEDGELVSKTQEENSYYFYPGHNDFRDDSYMPRSVFPNAHISSFFSMWCLISNADSWQSNPFVWVYEFKLV